jgi:PIN domain nuclease of toxin-antitoxin system
VRVLLDTQIIYLSAGTPLLEANLSERVKRLLADPETDRVLSSVSITEIAIKTSGGKLVMSDNEVRQATRDLRLTLMPFTAEHAYTLFHLPMHHRDPFDRMLIATALTEKIPIISGDRNFKKYRGLKVIW